MTPSPLRSYILKVQRSFSSSLPFFPPHASLSSSNIHLLLPSALPLSRFLPLFASLLAPSRPFLFTFPSLLLTIFCTLLIPIRLYPPPPPSLSPPNFPKCRIPLYERKEGLSAVCPSIPHHHHHHHGVITQFYIPVRNNGFPFACAQSEHRAKRFGFGRVS